MGSRKDLIKESDTVQKEELLHLHCLMIHVKTYLENIIKEEIHSERYNSLGTTTSHLHKNKKAHKDALMTLGNEIVTHINRQSIPVVNYSLDTALTKVVTVH
jgi:hypothetical protein